jgi:hypothetical protein
VGVWGKWGMVEKDKDVIMEVWMWRDNMFFLLSFGMEMLERTTIGMFVM